MKKRATVAALLLISATANAGFGDLLNKAQQAVDTASQAIKTAQDPMGESARAAEEQARLDEERRRAEEEARRQAEEEERRQADAERAKEAQRERELNAAKEAEDRKRREAEYQRKREEDAQRREQEAKALEEEERLREEQLKAEEQKKVEDKKRELAEKRRETDAFVRECRWKDVEGDLLGAHLKVPMNVYLCTVEEKSKNSNRPVKAKKFMGTVYMAGLTYERMEHGNWVLQKMDEAPNATDTERDYAMDSLIHLFKQVTGYGEDR